jgi:threonine aldolase
MVFFNCDYNEGAHPAIMDLMMRTNMEQTGGYGIDPYCEKARSLIQAACGSDDLEVQFLVGGTQANLTVIAATLRPHQGVISADSGHVNVHETGAIEATGHKVIALPSQDGKLTAQQVLDCYTAHWEDGAHEHIAQPGMVYISNPTEIGTIYSKAELQALSEVCRKCGLPLYMDGARMGYGLAAKENDLDLKTITACCDVFYIGGTKQGALFGEAVVIPNPAIAKDFRYMIKQRGGMLAKGRLLGIQFVGLFEDGLYFKLSEHAVGLAMKIREACKNKGYSFLVDSCTNQQFPILPNAVLEKLKEKYVFSMWGKVDEENSAVRFCTSWATKADDVEVLCADIAAL